MKLYAQNSTNIANGVYASDKMQFAVGGTQCAVGSR